jgi:hypothetical protein
MEHACYKCGALVQEGRAFCPNCNAPQIRVASPESDTPSFAPGTPGEMQPPAQPVILGPSTDLSPTGIDWSAGGPAVLIAGVLSGFCFFLPLNVAWVFAGGALAVWIYNRRRPSYMQISSGTGAKLGAVAGVIGYALFAIVAVLAFVFAGDKVWSEFIRQLKERASSTPDANLQQMFELLKTAEGKAFVATFVMIFAFALFVGLATLGGTIAAALLRKDQRPH